MKPNDLVDAALAAKKLASDYQLAKAIGESTGRISEIRDGKAPSDYITAKLAEVAGLDPAQTLIEIKAETEKNPKRQAFWQQLARAAVFLAVVSPFFATPTPQEPSNSKASGWTAVYYVK